MGGYELNCNTDALVSHTTVQGCPGQSRSGHLDLTNFEGVSRDYLALSRDSHTS